MNGELRQEQEHLQTVLRTISEQISRFEGESVSRQNEVVEVRKNFWDEVKVNTDSFDDVLETIISLRQQAQNLSVSQNIHKRVDNQLSVLRKMHEIPYFGRIDFTEEECPDSERIYIGVSSLTDVSGENFVVYDWRAPVSSVYYDYAPGPAEYDTPGGIVSGVLDQKWQYIIRNGEIESMFDTSLTIGDEILQHVLGKGTDKHMHSIVASIQQEQNLIIRHDKGRLLIVQGAAGSGKTSAALQRIAYLLYTYRKWIKADQIVLFSPNTMFNSYVSNVLPELGEENMQQVTFQKYLNHQLSSTFKVEDTYEQLEYLLTTDHDDNYYIRNASIRFKATTRFFEAIKSYRRSLESDGMIFKGIKFRGKLIVSDKQIAERFYSHDISLKFNNRIEKLVEWLNQLVNQTEQDEFKKSWVQQEIELLSKDEYQKVYNFLQEKHGENEDTFDDYERENRILRRMVLRKKFSPIRKGISLLRFINIAEIYKRLYSDPTRINQWLDGETPDEWEAICQQTIDMLKEGKLYCEDATPLLLIKEIIQGFQSDTSIKHVLVDEAQDYSPFQFEFLKRLFPSARMTVLGDFNQAIFAHSSEMVDFHLLNQLYGADETSVINLTRSYRSTKQIVEFTRSLLVNGQEIIPFERDGAKPILTKLTERDQLNRCIIEKVSELQEQHYNTIAIICKSAAESEKAYSELTDVTGLKLIKSNTMEYEQGVIVIPAYLAKGIEFDAVIIYDASAQIYADESVRRLFYTACTRAMHVLQLYCIGEPSPFVSGADPDSLLVE